MLCSACLYPIVFFLATILFFRLEKIDPYKNFYSQFSDQQECFQKLLFGYTQRNAAELWHSFPVLINKCSFTLLRPYFKTIRGGRRQAVYLPREKFLEVQDLVVTFNEFLAADEQQCAIVHVTEKLEDLRLELMMKQKYPDCKVVKLSTQASPDMDNQVEVVRAKLKLTFEKKNVVLEKKSLDLDTLLQLYLNNRIIEALYLDESVPINDLLEVASLKDFAKSFPVCQLTVTIKRPKSKSEEIEFWNFIRYFIVDSELVFVSSRSVDASTLSVVFYNPVNSLCNFKHFSIPFDKKGTKF